MDAPVGPGAEEEAFLAAEEGGSTGGDYSTGEPRSAEPPRPTAGIDQLVSRIPAATRKSLEDLLRARFTRVRRLREGELR